MTKESIFDSYRSGFVLTNTEGGQAVHTLRQSFNDLFSGTNIIDGNWHHVVGTYNASIGRGRIYVDGVLKNETINTAKLSVGSASLVFGAQNINADSP